jgi:hypothetical protein
MTTEFGIWNLEFGTRRRVRIGPQPGIAGKRPPAHRGESRRPKRASNLDPGIPTGFLDNAGGKRGKGEKGKGGSGKPRYASPLPLFSSAPFRVVG